MRRDQVGAIVSKGYEFTVEDCNSCPFYERHAVSAVADWLMKKGTKTGTCKHASDGRPFPWGRIQIDDPSKPPDMCPLRSGATTIRLKVIA